MKNGFAMFILVIVILSMIVLLTGCKGFFDHPGKTAAEIHRDHVRTMKVNHKELMSDIDRAVFLDKPSRLTEKRIP